MKPSLQVRLSQHLALTPQLQQSIRLLQLSTLELHQEVEQMLEQNPFLETDDDMPLPDRTALEAPAPDRTSASEEAWDGAETGSSPSDTPAEPDVAVDQMEFGATERDDWENGTERDDFDGIAESPGVRNGALDDDDTDWSERSTVALTLADHLRTQLRGLHLQPVDALLVEALIDSLSEDGYLADRLEDIADRLADSLELGSFPTVASLVHEPVPALEGELVAMVEDAVAEAAAWADEQEPDVELLREDLLGRLRCALAWLQNMEPTGVGARDLSECLLLQLRELPGSEARTVAMRICNGHLELLGRRDVKKLVAATASSEDLIRAAQSLIVTLEPKPGRRFSRAEANIIVPDVIVQKSGRGWRVVLNPDVMPKLRINDMYAQVLRQHRGQQKSAGNGADEAGSSLSARLQEARWFVKNILQRFDTIQRVSQAIVERQKGFFTHGEIAMKPLVLREIADELGLHESTISRVTTAKYMNTPFGTFELKYFFGSSLNTDAGGNASSTAVRALIKQFVAAEDPKKPLSDSQLSDMLEEQGIQVARRTVAKYREALKISPANQRKAM
ncbi:RNA polymerase RpoN-/SigL-like sigma 54 subunit [Sphaerotilus hippei]|uniref:RNA polymerase sigma-54 factor n=1 Tax=Sphaerotilus hippei TaxID=744406 RepID=A0A318H5Q4_9BURK|nr:RNA polymerase factor sigma-54 [Sphaerotilus hippei]PXW99250.1 RNA polymerase RpoN-/SigL-like sigma 54 subunit [Sphaerotilus hippei]